MNPYRLSSKECPPTFQHEQDPTVVTMELVYALAQQRKEGRALEQVPDYQIRLAIFGRDCRWYIPASMLRFAAYYFGLRPSGYLLSQFLALVATMQSAMQ